MNRGTGTGLIVFGVVLGVVGARPDSLPRSALGRRVRRHDLLGGLIHEYELVA